MKCNHKEELFYYNSVNEDGWKCISCGEELGFRPDLDKKLIDIKVRGILADMYDAKLIYISNGCEGDGITSYVSTQCIKKGRFDQYFIIKCIIDCMYKSHSDYWKKESSSFIFNQKEVSDG